MKFLLKYVYILEVLSDSNYGLKVFSSRSKVLKKFKEYQDEFPESKYNQIKKDKSITVLSADGSEEIISFSYRKELVI